MSEMNETKTIAELHELSTHEIKNYKSEVWKHFMAIDALLTYIDKIGRPKLLAEPTEVEFEEEE